MTRIRLLTGAVLLLAAACGDSGGDATPTEAPPPAPLETITQTTTTVPATTIAPTTPPSTEAPATTPPGPAIVLGDPGSSGAIPVSIDTSTLAPLFNSFISGDDPYYNVHTQQDNLFIGVELYTVFGSSWTGALGTFPTDCSTHGICVYLDPDGTGPLPASGPGTGTITISQLDGGTILTLDDVSLVGDDGQVYTMSGVTLGG